MDKKSFNDQIQKLILLLYRLRGMILYLYCIIIQNQFPYHNLLGYQGSLWVHLLVQLFKCCVILHHFLFDETIMTFLRIYIFSRRFSKFYENLNFVILSNQKIWAGSAYPLGYKQTDTQTSKIYL